MSMSASNSDSSIKAKELGTKHYQRMNDEEGDLYYGLRSAMRSPGPNQGRFALVQMAMILEIKVSEQRFKDFVQVHLGMLPTMLKECEKTKSFKPFINLFVSGKFLGDLDAGRYTINQYNIEQAWATKYEGDVHRQVLKIVQNERASEAYRNSAALLQSSGYGKSRSLKELEQLIATMPMNVHPNEVQSGTYPRPDEPLLTLLMQIAEKLYATIQDAVNALHTFFATLFERIKKEIVSLALSTQDVGKFALSWQTHLQTNNHREAIYSDVKDMYDTRKSSYLKSSDAVHRLRELLTHIPALRRIKENQTDLHFIMYMDEAHSLAQAPMRITEGKFTLLEILNKAITEYNECGMFFLFASTVSPANELAPPKTLLDSARRAQASLIEPIVEMSFDCHRDLRSALQPNTLRLEDVQKFSHSARFGRPLFWTLLESYADYKTGISDGEVLGLAAMKLAGTPNYSPLHADAAKLAVLDVALSLDYHPFRTNTFDLEQKMVSSHMRTVFTVPKSRFFLHSGYPSEPVLAEAALNVVYLQELQVVQAAPLSSGEDLPMAVESNELLPGRGTTSQAEMAEEDSMTVDTPVNVSSHRSKDPTDNIPMAIATDPSFDHENEEARQRDSLEDSPADVSMETPLTIPAIPQAIKDPIARLFSSLDEGTSGAVDMGQRGENVGKMILLQAYMNAVKESGPETPWRNGCSVTSFLRHLLVQTKEANVECSLPDNVMNGMELKESFKDSWIRFTHFARGADESAMTSSMAYAAFLRGMAVIGWSSQNMVDVMIPILLRTDLPICEDIMSGLLVQFKCRGRPGSVNALTIEERTTGFFPPEGSERDNSMKTMEETKELYANRPYISLVMELGVAPTAPPSARTPAKIITVKQPRQDARRNPNPIPYSPSRVKILDPPQRQSHRKVAVNTHPRYSIFVYGCDSDVYRCIPRSEAATERYRRLLHVGGLLSDHARPYTSEDIRGLKPFWSAGSACFSWVSDKFLNAEF